MNEILYKNNKEIVLKLTQGQTTILDLEDYEKIKNYNWYASYDKKGRTFYCRVNVMKNKKWYCYILHRIILQITNSRTQIDHKNHNTLDNRKENLRICMNGENNRNVRKQRRNTSGYKGVSFHVRRNKWQVSICVNNKLLYLGLFSDPKEGAKIYDKAAKYYFGEFAYLNFPNIKG